MTTQPTDSLRDLAHSTYDFYRRFNVTPTQSDSIMNFEEEVHELIEAVHAGTDPDHIAEEAADVMVTAIGVCQSAGVDIEQIIERVYFVIAKNNAKTHETHVHKDGKIRRRSSLSA
jgi:NTP pyrophosphatase (non-canonical NTP hydrolase)